MRNSTNIYCKKIVKRNDKYDLYLEVRWSIYSLSQVDKLLDNIAYAEDNARFYSEWCN